MEKKSAKQEVTTSPANAKEISIDVAFVALREISCFVHMLTYLKGSVAPLLFNNIIFLCLK